MTLLRTLPVALLCAPALAQGSDDCASAQAITGLGPFSFDASIATTDGAPDSLCLFFGQDDIENDVWFSWTAPSDGPFIAACCGLSSSDTRIATYTGGCGSAASACDDDGCSGSLQSSVRFDATMGQTVLLRIGNYPGAAAVVGDFDIRPARVTNPANGHVYELVSESLGWNDAQAAAQATLNGGVPGHLVTISDQAELDFILNNLAPSRPWIGLSQNVSSSSYSEPGGGWEWVTGEPFTFVNWSAGEPNDISGSGGPENYAEMFASGVWNDAEEFHAPTNQYIVEWGGDGAVIQTNFCMALPNSTGAIGEIRGVGSSVIASNDMTLEASNLPPGQFGIFVVSMTGLATPVPVMNGGNLCLGGQIGRYSQFSQIQQVDAAGMFELSIDLTAVPQPSGLVSIVAGENWSFQAWHRDGGALPSNFTNGVEISFI
ncbi:MAG: C-type lectin domain-containing protein [Planctomycetota bacterium]